MAETQIKDLPSGGTPLATTHITVQQANADSIGQQIQWTNFLKKDIISGQQFSSETLAITPKSFADTLASETSIGTVQLASNTDITNGTGNDVLSASKMDKIFEEGIKQTGDINQSDVDAASQGTVTINSIRASTFGKLVYLSGQFTFDSSASEEKRSLYFNNTRVPVQYTAIGGQYERSDKVGLKLPMTLGVESAGANRIRMDISTEGEGVNWDTGLTYTIDFTIQYFTP